MNGTDGRLLLEEYSEVAGSGGGDLRGVNPSSLAGLRRSAKALLAQFVAGVPAAAKEALAANPAEKAAAAAAAAAASAAAAAAAAGSASASVGGYPAAAPAAPAASTAMEVDTAATGAGAGAGAAGSEAAPGRGQAWLEGVMMTVIQLAKHGDAAHVAGDIALLLPTVLRVQEPPDRDFALVAKRTLTYLKYIIFPRENLAVVVAGLLEGLRDAQWHARAASLKFLQAFAFRHAFLLTPDELASLRDEVMERLTDQQIEVRLLAGDTLIGFLKGVGARVHSAEALRARCLAAAAPPPRKKRRAATAAAAADKDGGGGGEGGSGNGGEGAGAAANAETLRRHGAVLGASACVLSSPYGVPEWMPEMLETLARWAGEPSPVKETVQRTFSEFKKTHQDTWLQTKVSESTVPPGKSLSCAGCACAWRVRCSLVYP